MELEESEDNIFVDTANHWSRGWITTAYKQGLIYGYSDSVFGPDDLLTRTDGRYD
ncbi:S-layer homology domain-containing protein [Paenibacillus physcomitrellae]|uniref:SLH domain-containing protein n=1 Tax=Paenibacillus physcomitrellae TaxID=1619311 RepID=A0ABQ1G0H7_9BACL|nr:hypothetical protein GCM10010917_19500 [Paenibacillus physcomitrellae]